jgi:membrane-bound ClpP family serine protease
MMPIISDAAVNKIIRLVIGLAFLVVGVELFSTGALGLGVHGEIAVSIVLFIVGAVFLYIAVRMLIRIARDLGGDFW